MDRREFEGLPFVVGFWFAIALIVGIVISVVFP